MLTNLHSRGWSRSVTFAVWALVGASAVYWLLKFGAAPAGDSVAPVAAPSAAPADPLAVARLLGAPDSAALAAPVASLASRFVLVGVVATDSRRGAALIALDGKPAKPYRVGSTVDDGLVLQSVAPRRAVLGSSLDGPAAFTLELQPPKRS